MYEYRQVLLRLRLGATDREVARAQHIGRAKVAHIRQLAGAQGWLEPSGPMPEDAQLAAVFKLVRTAAQNVSSVEPFRDQILAWHSQGIQATTIRQALARIHGFEGSVHSVYRFLQQAAPKTPAASVMLDFAVADAAQVDFGQGPLITDRASGEVIKTWIFVMTLAWSRHQYAQIVPNQKVETWLACHRHAFEWFNGVPKRIVIDNPKCAISRACYYEPQVQRSYSECALGYGFIIAPCPPRDPQKKAKVEAAVLVAQRWILAALRHRTFYSLAELNAAIAELLLRLNDRVMRHVNESRRSLYERLDRPALKPLPATRYEYAEWKQVKVNIDYHVEFDDHYYSTPYTLIGEALWCRATTTTIELFHKDKRVASHPRSYAKYDYSTVPEHRPASHRAHLEWTPSRLIEWGTSIGPHTGALIEHVIRSKPHPEQGYRSALGILRLSNKHGKQRLELASAKAIAIRSPSYKTVKTMLDQRMEAAPLRGEAKRADDPATSLGSANVRGSGYYH